MSAVDKSQGGIGEPANHAETVVTSDAEDLATVTRGLWVGGAGNVAAVMLGGQTVTFVGVQAGTLLPIRVKRVLATGTTATYMVGVY